MAIRQEGIERVRFEVLYDVGENCAIHAPAGNRKVFSTRDETPRSSRPPEIPVSHGLAEEVESGAGGIHCKTDRTTPCRVQCKFAPSTPDVEDSIAAANVHQRQTFGQAAGEPSAIRGLELPVALTVVKIVIAAVETP
jgi:hypothetical protein